MITRGSEWHRWDPHMHGPGTVLNDQFGNADPWPSYLDALESVTPTIEAIGITDYYVCDTYERLIAFKQLGRLPDVKFIFPNIELRLDAAAKSGFVNVHLLVNPKDPHHLTEIRRFLQRLEFQAFGDSFHCTQDELIKLGKCADPKIANGPAALRHGATQFKVNFAELRKVYNASSWAQENVLIAVAGGSSDGTSGMRQAADSTLRQEIEKFAHIIFSSSSAQREFWAGQGSASVEQLHERYDGCKPCLHGSDSHRLDEVGRPDEDRCTWIKGSLDFDTLRQACVDPLERAYIGDQPPRPATPSQIISHIAIQNADWITTPEIPLNPGLIAIIGPRGSGKTALADLIAAGCDAIESPGRAGNENAGASFISRARNLIGATSIALTWASGEPTTRRVVDDDAVDQFSFPRARYLSQQFVEELCSAKGISDGLVDEIERVIFDSLSKDDIGALDFSELRDQETARFRQAREREAASIADISDRIASELEKESIVPSLNAQVTQKKKLISDYKKDLAKLAPKGNQNLVAKHAQLADAAAKLRKSITDYTNQRRTFLALGDEVRSMRATGSPEMLRQAMARHYGSGLNPKQWEEFLLVYKGDVDASLNSYIAWADNEIRKLTGTQPPLAEPNSSYIGEDLDLATVPLAPIVAEMGRLEALVGADKSAREKYTALSNRIAQENAALQALETKFKDASGAADRKKGLQTEREETYERIFDAIVNEQKVLARLYSPLMERLALSQGTLKKLSFSVKRIADVSKWGTFAEEKLLDLRKGGVFNGRGSVVALAEKELRRVWETGDPVAVKNAMSTFLDKYAQELIAHTPDAATHQAEFRAWTKRLAHWLFDTAQIEVQYEISYDGVDIRKLSPGTRGIVLLLLYLALDESDNRPLIIDQPEENLDPKSVFDELVGLFINAKSKRQVIMVTHNANLVINTDADQVIIAASGPHPTGGLPPITYVSGGLENLEIRRAVCEILEGGEAAFRERARRLRLRLDR